MIKESDGQPIASPRDGLRLTVRVQKLDSPELNLAGALPLIEIH